MPQLSVEQIKQIRANVLGAAAKIPGTLIGLGVLLIILGMHANCFALEGVAVKGNQISYIVGIQCTITINNIDNGNW